MRTAGTLAMLCATAAMALAAAAMALAPAPPGLAAVETAVAPAAAAGPAASATETTATGTGAAPPRGIFVPKPKGAGESLDDSVESSAPAERTDVVTTLRGDRLFGNVVGIGPRGSVRFTSGQFEGDVLFAASALDLVILTGTEQDSGPAEVLLPGGDRVVGSVVAIDDDVVTIETQAAGRIRIAAGAVQMVNLRRPTVLVASAFGSGKMEPWADGGRGGWTVADGALVCRNRTIDNRSDFGPPLYAQLDQEEAITMVAKVEAIGQGNFSYDLVLFADLPTGNGRTRRYGQASIFGSFSPTEAHPIVNSRGAIMMVGSRTYAQRIDSGVLRFAYDPATARARLWLNDVDLGSYAAPIPPKGRFVMFNSSDSVRVEFLRVLRGIVPPEDDGFVPAATSDGMTVEMATKERLAVAHIALVGDQVTLTTSAGQIRSPISGVRRIEYGRKPAGGGPAPGPAGPGPAAGRGPAAAAAPGPAAAGMAQVRTDCCRITLRLDRITSDEVVGRSEVLGEVKIRRAAVRDIRFHFARK